MYLKSHLTIIENLFDFLYVLVYKQSASLCVPFKSPACFQRSCFFYCTHHRRLSLLCHASRFIFSQFFFFERQTGTYHPIHGAERIREYGESWGGAFQLI